MSRPRGRPQRLAVDATPWEERSWDATRRTAWLLAVARLLGPRTATMSRAAFIRDMAEQGVTLDSSRVSRLEAGEYPIRSSVIDGYERVIGVPSGSLQSVNALLRRAGGLPRDVERHAPENTSLVDRAADRIEHQVAHGNDWLTLTRGLESHEHYYLMPRTWRELTDQLVGELTRSTGAAFHRRYEAALTLQDDPVGRRQLAMSVGRFVMHPDVQSVDPAMSLLQQRSDPATGDLVLRLMQDDNQLRRRGAARVAGAIAAGQGIGALHATTVEHYLIRELSASGRRRQRIHAVDLTSRLPPESYSRVLDAIADLQTRSWVARSCATLELIDADTSRNVVETIASGAEHATGRFADDPDRMLRRLLREALFHIHRERRQLAAITLAASPYAAGVAQTTLRVTQERDPLVTTMCWPLLRRCGHLLERDQVAAAAIIERSGELVPHAVMLLGFGHGPLPTELADRLLAAAPDDSNPQLAHAALFTLGMAGHAHLSQLSDRPGHCQATAGWWQKLGPALDDGL